MQSANMRIDQAEQTQEHWIELGNAVVMQAVRDYRTGVHRMAQLQQMMMKRLKMSPEDRAKIEQQLSTWQMRLGQIEDFLCSDRFGIFSQLNGNDLIARLRKEAA